MADEKVIPVGPIGQLQDDCCNLLRGSAYFADIPVIYEKMKEIQYEIDKALGSLQGQGGRSGVFVIVATPKQRVLHPNLPGPVFDDVTVLVRVIEDPLVNQGESGTRKRAVDVAHAVAQTLHHKTRQNLYDPLICEEAGAAADNDLPSYVIYDVRFKTGLKA